MRPWINKLAGCDVINFVFYDNRVGRLVERIFDGKRYLTLVINEIAFSDALLAVMEEKLWLSKSLDPHYFDRKIEVIKKIKLDSPKGCSNKPTISLPLGGNSPVEISHGVNNLGVSFSASKFVEEVINHIFRENPVISLCDTPERNHEFRIKWEEMLKSLDSSNPGTGEDL